MGISEIEKLESRWRENPQGLTFAPLAEAYRKTGELARALEVLRPGLEKHPDYIPASIVLGRCHLDLGDLSAAETAFTHVLSLDGENVIALKALADITERQARFDEAERWLHSLLSIDRTNDEAREQLQRIEAARAESAVAVAVAPDPAPVLDVAEPVAEPVADVEPAPVADDPEPPAPAEPVEASAEPVEAVEEPNAVAAAEIEPMAPRDTDAGDLGLMVEEPETFDEPVAPLPGLVGREADALASEPVASIADEPPPADPARSADADFRVELPEEIVLESSGVNEYQTPSAAELLIARARDESPFAELASTPEPEVAPEATESREAPDEALEEMPADEPEPAPPVLEPAVVRAVEEEPATLEPAAEPTIEPTIEPIAEPVPEAVAFEAEPQPEPPAEPAPEPEEAPVPASVAEAPLAVEPEPELVVTETMAELYRRQGHHSEALRVYRELESRSPDDERLREVITALEEETGVIAAQSTARPRLLARDTGGQTVREFFRNLLAARPAPAPSGRPGVPSPPAMPPAAASPEAAPPAPGTPVGGAPTRPASDPISLSAVFGDTSSPVPPAAPASPAPASGVSFDDFFGAPGAGQEPRARPEPKRDDLDEFNTWLQNLKR